MIDTKEALARILIADFEARRLKEKSETRRRRWRLVVALSRGVVIFAAGVYLQVTHTPITGAQACGLFLLYMASSAWEDHRTAETLRLLQAEVDRLKEEIKSKAT